MSNDYVSFQQTLPEEMNEGDMVARANNTHLPDSWQRVLLGDVVTFTKKPNRLRYTDFGQVPFVPMDFLPIGELTFDQFVLKGVEEISSGTYFEPGDILLAKITPSFENGKQGIIEKLPAPFGIATTEVIPIKAIEGVSDRYFLFYYLLRQTVRHLLAGRMDGSTGRQRLSVSTLAGLELFLPPLLEQRAISLVLQAVQETIQARRREIELEREQKAALTEYLFTHGTCNEPLKQTELGEMPERWEVFQLQEVAEVAYGFTVNVARRNALQRVPYLAVANVMRGALRLDEVKQVGMLEGDAERYRLQKGDVLLVEGNGNPALLGSAAIWNDELPFALHQNHLIRVRPDQKVVLPDWLMDYLNSHSGRVQLLGKAKTSSGLHSINSQLVAHLYIPLPSLSEQRTVVEAMTTCNTKITALEREKELLGEFFQTLLEELMTGRLSTIPLIEKEGHP